MRWDSEFAREKAWARVHLIPLLEAEADRDVVRRQIAAEARERELMKDVKGWKFGSVYNTERCVLLSPGFKPIGVLHSMRLSAKKTMFWFIDLSDRVAHRPQQIHRFLSPKRRRKTIHEDIFCIIPSSKCSIIKHGIVARKKAKIKRYTDCQCS